MATFELRPESGQPQWLKPFEREGLGGSLLLSNIRWFTRVRWIVVAIFLAAALSFDVFAELPFGLSSPAGPLWALAAGLAAVNTVFFLTARRFDEQARVAVLKTHLWAQIGVDLLAVTFLVHSIGSTDTFVSLTYLFHIALSCIFFPARESLLVTLVASTLYVATVLLETARLWPAAGILAGLPAGEADPSLKILFALSAVFSWIVVWYLVSTLSRAVRRRDTQLQSANEELREADRRKNQQVIVTTHELKAPFSGIASNIQILRLRFWQELSEPVRDIIERIELRSRTLSGRINAILLLGELRTGSGSPPRKEPVDLRGLVDSVVDELTERAEATRVAVDVRVPAMTVPANAKHFSILLTNLVANAITYSHEGGKVEVSAGLDRGSAWLRVVDHGIGIREDALPHIFEEYYRSSEAARYNKLSTGLGLAIVKEIARAYSLVLRVESESGKGSTFEVMMPANGDCPST